MDKTINMQLMALLGRRDLVERWWSTPNQAFEMDTPETVWCRSPEGPDIVRRYIAQFLYGDYF
jgi:hypothetical protein